MSPKLFTMKQREEIKIKLLEKGFALIKKHGMTHASVDKITKASGIGKSTFYNFFPSKEMFVYEIMCYERDKSKQQFTKILGNRNKLTQDEAKKYLKSIIFSNDSIYKYLTNEDKIKLQSVLPSECCINGKEDADVMSSMFSHMENVRDDIDYKVVGNIIKIMALAMVNKEVLYQDVLDNTLEEIFELQFSLIFNN